MATLDIDGRNVEVDDSFLELSPKEQNDVVGKIASSLGAKSGGDINSVGSGVANVAKAFGTGVAKGVADVAGLPGDAAGALGGIVDWLAGRAGLPAVSDKAGHAVQSAARALPGVGPALTLYDLGKGALSKQAREVIDPFRGSEAANRIVQGITGPYRTSQTVPEQYAETMGRFVPAAASTAGEGAVLLAPQYRIVRPHSRRSVGSCGAGFQRWTDGNPGACRCRANPRNACDPWAAPSDCGKNDLAELG